MLPAAHAPMPLPGAQLSSRGPPTWGWPTLGQLGLQSTQETSSIPWYLPCHLQLSPLCSANLAPKTTSTFHN